MSGRSLRPLFGTPRVWLVLVALAAVAAVAEQAIRRLHAGPLAPTGEARWIWTELDDEASAGVAFFAYRDFELDGYPGRARLSCRGDEESFVYLNGTLVDVGVDGDGGRLPTYEVGSLLVPGVNRLAVELRSGRRAGGFLLDLVVEGRHPTRVVSDGEWRMTRLYQDEILVPGAQIAGAEPVSVGPAPAGGRGAPPRAGDSRLLFTERIEPVDGLHARRARSDRTGGGWRTLEAPSVSSPPLGRVVTFDWGREVIGYANVVFGRREGARALVFAGVAPPDPATDRPIAYLINSPGRKSWSDTRPRRFRYLTVVATAEMVGARALTLAPELARSALSAARPGGGVFGLEPLRLGPPIEHEIRRELESLASVADGEGA